MRNLLSYLSVALCLVVSTQQAKAQFNQIGRVYNKYAGLQASGNSNAVDMYQRMEIGYTLPKMNLSIEHNVFRWKAGGEYIDTTIRLGGVNNIGYGAVSGTFFPVSSMGESSNLSIAAACSGNIYLWEFPGIKYGTGDRGQDLEYDEADNVAFFVECGFPVSLDYKFGGHAIQDKSKRFLFTGGLGTYPQIFLGGWSAGGGVKFRSPIFVKTEVGFFAGIAFKVRATYTLGTARLFDQKFEGNYLDYRDNEAEKHHIVMKAKSNIALSLIIMPFSWDWGGGQWWR